MCHDWDGQISALAHIFCFNYITRNNYYVISIRVTSTHTYICSVIQWRHLVRQAKIYGGIYEMVVCCRCNGNGSCKNCACVRTKRLCTTCLPLRKGKCSNTKQLTTAKSPASAFAQSPVSTDDSQPSISANTALPSNNLVSLNNQLTNKPANNHDSSGLQSFTTQIRAQPPPFVSISQTPFVWVDYDSDSFSASLQMPT